MGWMTIVNKHDGYLPILIESLPEGTVFNSHNCQVQVVNTDDECFWLVSYIETALIRALWYPSSVATISRNIKKVLKKYWDLTSDAPIESIEFKLHDFGSRGASSQETAKLGGMAHLVNFKGTDTAVALIGAMQWYGDINNPENNMPGFSIPASEHSTITSWGVEHEEDAYRNMVQKYAGEGKIYACVSDSYDFHRAVDDIWGTDLKDEILKAGGTLVVRPDSGEPVTEVLFALNSLYKNFGGEVNSKGYKVLNPSVRLIQGDGIDPTKLEEILYVMYQDGWAIDNIAFGMGGGLLQKVNRDTFSYAQKACAKEVGGEITNVFKKPATDSKKASKKGILSTYRENGKWVTTNDRMKNEMIPIFKHGQLLNETTFDEIRERAKL
jgi:nicotinamide phosphoribosyltransferase